MPHKSESKNKSSYISDQERKSTFSSLIDNKKEIKKKKYKFQSKLNGLIDKIEENTNKNYLKSYGIRKVDNVAKCIKFLFFLI